MSNGTVKWFNASKGFGFIAPDDGGADIFVHVSALEQAGIRGLNDGDLVSFDVEEDRRSGKESATNLRVTGSGSAASRRPAPAPWAQENRGASSAPAGGASGGQGRGTVKWFNPQKGFGFIQPDDGGQDVFVHISAVERAGIQDLREGEIVTYDLEQGRTGKTSAVNLRFAQTDR